MCQDLEKNFPDFGQKKSGKLMLWSILATLFLKKIWFLFAVCLFILYIQPVVGGVTQINKWLFKQIVLYSNWIHSLKDKFAELFQVNITVFPQRSENIGIRAAIWTSACSKIIKYRCSCSFGFRSIRSSRQNSCSCSFEFLSTFNEYVQVHFMFVPNLFENDLAWIWNVTFKLVVCLTIERYA